MSWPQLDKLAPGGYILINNEIVPATHLIRKGYSSITTYLTKNARNMTVKKIEFINNQNGDLIRNLLYDVYFEEDEPHCLNVFGARMLKDRLDRGDPANENRFNYTGLQ